jgi:SAM-dependent methyltransferase
MDPLDPQTLAFKTDAWKHPSAVATYAHNVSDGVSANRLKNAVEVDLIREWVTGTDILDVGVGTGRAAIPLARAGYRVSGIDSSAAMLERTRADAAPAELDLRVGDVNAIPYADDSFDSLVALNVAVHFGHWRTYLHEWRRVVRPGGRLVFDIHSSDTVDAVSRATGTPPEALLATERSWAGTYVARLRLRELQAFADENDLTIEAMVPYGLFYGSGEITFLGRSLARGALLQRFLSTMATDERFFAFCAFLERELIGRLTPSTTGRVMVVLRNGSGRDANAAFAERTATLDAMLASGPAFASLAPYLALPAEEWRARAERHLAYGKNRAFAAVLATAMPAAWCTPALIDAAFGDADGGRVRQLRALHDLDLAIDALGDDWYPPAAVESGVSLGALTRYMVTLALFEPSAERRSSALE